jgi:SAM-dependent methyltransferase
MTKLGHGLGNLFAMVDNPDKSWRKFGKKDPYYGVLTADRFRRENLDEAALSDFFASGESHITKILEITRRHVAADLSMNNAVDFGCGVGRLVLPLARRYNHATGIDISEDYIAEAVRNCQKHGIINADFRESVEQLASERRRFDLAHSSIVFNHIPWSRGQEIIRGLYELLNPGGVMAIQVLHRHKRGSLRRISRWARRAFAPFNWIANVLQKRSIFEPLMQGNAYPLDELLPYLTALGAENIHVRPEAVTPSQSFAFIFCRKPQAKDASTPAR